MDEERTLRASAAPSRPSGKSVVAAGLGVFAVCGVAATRVGFGPAAGGLSGLFATTATTPAASYDAAPSSELSFYVWSDYVDEYGDVGTDYSWFSDGGYDAIVEPYVPQTLVADCPTCPPETTYTWTFSGGETVEGPEAERMFYSLES